MARRVQGETMWCRRGGVPCRGECFWDPWTMYHAGGGIPQEGGVLQLHHATQPCCYLPSVLAPAGAGAAATPTSLGQARATTIADCPGKGEEMQQKVSCNGVRRQA